MMYIQRYSSKNFFGSFTNRYNFKLLLCFISRAEYSYLKSLLDPEESNPEITVSILAKTLNKYSESQKIKVDLEERQVL